VGYAQNSEITESYNTGFVGAGNYSSTKYSLAGGIFGYGNGVTVSSCINDGAVQAINKVDNTKQKITSTKTSGEGESVDYMKTPNKLTYEVISTYNSGDFRQVYAYGIGYAGEGNNSFESNSTSTRNIKNDGNMGEFTDKKEIVFI